MNRCQPATDAVSEIRRPSAGFTLPELIAVIVITGILAAVAVPRMMTRSSFDVFGFTEQAADTLRFAQKMAIAKRRYTCVNLSANTITLQYASVQNPATGCDSPVLNPSDGSVYSIAVPSGLAVAPAGGLLMFDTQGRPLGLTGPVTITVSSSELSRTITLEAETGYVH